MQDYTLSSNIVPMLFSLLSLLQTAAASPPELPTTEDMYSRTLNPHALDSAKNSGAVCVHFIEQMYGGDRGFWAIAELCRVSRAGTSLGDIQDGIRRLGLHATAFQGTTATLKRIRHPVIVRAQRTSEQESTQRTTKNYFMVVREWDAKRELFHVFESDREEGEITFSDLDQRFAGTGLLISKQELSTIESGFHPKPPRIAAFASGAISVWIRGL